MTGSITQRYIDNIRENAMSNVSTPSKTPAQPTDPRFKNDRFRAAVKYVLEWLGYVSNMGNFRKFDSMVDWLALARYLQHPPEVDKPCSHCGKFDCVMIEIIATKKQCCVACWGKILKKRDDRKLWKLVKGQPVYLGEVKE